MKSSHAEALRAKAAQEQSDELKKLKEKLDAMEEKLDRILALAQSASGEVSLPASISKAKK